MPPEKYMVNTHKPIITPPKRKFPRLSGYAQSTVTARETAVPSVIYSNELRYPVQMAR